MRRTLTVAMLCVLSIAALAAVPSSALAAPPPCPRSQELADLEELEEFVLEAGGQIGAELTAFFELVDENNDGLICFKTLPEATPLPTPPLLAGDNRLPRG